jgi:hypothetical protein
MQGALQSIVHRRSRSRRAARKRLAPRNFYFTEHTVTASFIRSFFDTAVFGRL